MPRISSGVRGRDRAGNTLSPLIGARFRGCARRVPSHSRENLWAELAMMAFGRLWAQRIEEIFQGVEDIGRPFRDRKQGADSFQAVDDDIHRALDAMPSGAGIDVTAGSAAATVTPFDLREASKSSKALVIFCSSIIGCRLLAATGISRPCLSLSVSICCGKCHPATWAGGHANRNGWTGQKRTRRDRRCFAHVTGDLAEDAGRLDARGRCRATARAAVVVRCGSATILSAGPSNSVFWRIPRIFSCSSIEIAFHSAALMLTFGMVNPPSMGRRRIPLPKKDTLRRKWRVTTHLRY